MAAISQADEWALTNDQAVEGKLGPAEVHDIVRQELERLAIAWGLQPTDVHRLAGQMRSYTYAPGETILPSRVRTDFLGLLVRGRVGVRTSALKAARQVGVLLPGSTFGDIAPHANSTSDETLQALSRCEIWFLRRTDLEGLSNKRRAEQRLAVFWRVLAWSALVLVGCLVTMIALSLSPVRQAVAVVPMGIGQWCSLRAEGSGSSERYEGCARAAWTLAANLAPADANPLLALGNQYFEQGNLEAARHSFEAAQALAPDLAEIHNNLGLIYAEQGEHEQAINAFQRALDLEPGTAAIEHNLGLSLQAIQNYEEALTHFELALAFGEPRVSTLVNMAIGYYETGQPDEARDFAEQALSHDDTLAPAHTVLGAVALQSQQPEAALSQLRRAIALDGGYSQAFFYLGLAHKALDQPAEAIAAFEQALATADEEVVRVRVRRHLQELYETEAQGSFP